MMKKQFKDALWCDCENDTDRANFIAMGRACETGIISKSIQSELVNVFNYRAGWSEERLGQLTRIAELEAESTRKGKETKRAIDVVFCLINGFAEAETCIAELEGQLKKARAADAIAKSNVLDVQQECIKANKRITELEADIKLLEAGVVTVDGEREVLYGRIDELEQALEGGK